MFKITENESKNDEQLNNFDEISIDKKEMTNQTNMSEESATHSEQTNTNTTTNNNNSNNSVKRKLRSLAFGRRKKTSNCLSNKCEINCNTNTNINSNTNNVSNYCNNCKIINTNAKKKKSSSVWAFRLCARTDSCTDVTQTDNTCDSCICTAYKKTDEQELNESDLSTVTTGIGSNENTERFDTIQSSSQLETNIVSNATPLLQQESNESITPEESINEPYVDSSLMAYGVNGVDSVGTYQSPTYATQSMMSEVRSVQVRVSELALALRSQLALTVSPYPYLARWGDAELTPGFLNRFCIRSDSSQALNDGQQIHTQIDYIHCLVPDLLQITNCSFYWGKMDRYEAERLLDNKPEGTFLLRDSAQEEHLFSVSFRRFDRSLHARIEQWNHRFSFDSHDPGVYASTTVCGLIEHYKDPSHCMFFEPMLTIPLHRNFTFSLQHLSRATITSRLTYDTIHSIQLPKRLKNYLKEYHYKQQVRVRRLDGDH